MIFTNIEKIDLPKTAEVGKGFTVIMTANGKVPFAQAGNGLLRNSMSLTKAIIISKPITLALPIYASALL
jgi:hypothetical protein